MIQRRKPLRRSGLKRSTKPIPRRRAKPRRGPELDPGYVEWLHARKCCVPGCFEGPVVGAHTLNNGMRQKGPDSSRVPLCSNPFGADHHAQYDGQKKLPNGEVGREAFEAYYGMDMKREREAHYGLYTILKEAA